MLEPPLDVGTSAKPGKGSVARCVVPVAEELLRRRGTRIAEHLTLVLKAWLEAECLRRCRRLPPCRHLEAVKIERTKPTGSGPNWQVVAFKPELNEIAHQEAMKTIDVVRGTYALAKGPAA
jgi:hypothetical protein